MMLKTYKLYKDSLKLLTPTSDFNLVLDGAKIKRFGDQSIWNDPANVKVSTITYTVFAKTGTNLVNSGSSKRPTKF
jgi:hypothetical protein